MIKSRNNSDYQNFLLWLKKCRLEKGLTVRQLGVLLDEPFQSVSKIENGQRNLTVHEYTQYCEVMGIDCTIGINILIPKSKIK